MSWTNYHGHCSYCDGHKEVEDYIIEAINRKMPVIGFSSHAPVPFDCFWTMPHERLSSYIKDISELKEKYNAQIRVLTSLEIDYIPNLTGPNFPFLDDVQLDYKIGSIHFVDKLKNGEPWAIDGSFDEFMVGVNQVFEGDIRRAVERFFELTREMIRTQEFEIIGHFDKIKMHNHTKPLFDESSDWYQAEIEKTLNLIADKKLIVEINTKSYDCNGLLFPGVDLFKKMLDKNISVTINSDAHYPDKLEVGYGYVAQELYNSGYRYLKELINSKWVEVAFTEKGLEW
ncbi:histidinol-phosphatase [Labilibacter sediminis]|nr:histidinol-phosphatase [Labilibacter sediminis]